MLFEGGGDGGSKESLGVISAAASSAFTTTTTIRTPILTSKCSPHLRSDFAIKSFALLLSVLSWTGYPLGVFVSASSSATFERLQWHLVSIQLRMFLQNNGLSYTHPR